MTKKRRLELLESALRKESALAKESALRKESTLRKDSVLVQKDSVLVKKDSVLVKKDSVLRKEGEGEGRADALGAGGSLKSGRVLLGAGAPETGVIAETAPNAMSLVAEKVALERRVAPLDEEAMARQAELRILRQLAAAQQPLLRPREETGPDQQESRRCRRWLGWRPHSKYQRLSGRERTILLNNSGIRVQDSEVPDVGGGVGTGADEGRTAEHVYPVLKFEHLRLPAALVEHLKREKGIRTPSPIQQVSLPTLLSGRDFLGVAGTGSGKTLCYLLPMAFVCLASYKLQPFRTQSLRSQHAQPLRSRRPPLGQDGRPGSGGPGSGSPPGPGAPGYDDPGTESPWPCSLVLVPSRELALQIAGNANELLAVLSDAYRTRVPLRCACAIGGVSTSGQGRVLANSHGLVATPGRLKDVLDRGFCVLAGVRYFVIDEADRLLDGSGFLDTVRAILDYLHPRDERLSPGNRPLPAQRVRPWLQSALFSATMPPKVRELAKTLLRWPVSASMGSGSVRVSSEVRQRVELVAHTARVRLKFLLRALVETPPPVIVFCSSKLDVDAVFETMLRRGVEAVAIHGGLSQEDRQDAFERFAAGRADVLVASDVAAKGLDFPRVRHVINYDMPPDIEAYVHRVGRTGRDQLSAGTTSGRTTSGLATTFVTSACLANETVLLDLRSVLLQARQTLPKFLTVLAEHCGLHQTDVECTFCGGPGHRLVHCPRLRKNSGRNSTLF
ncbi:helicase [Gregarina niphandrodes]|uniref:RNA helicase n=1 Tax=Gregarina niphandrodes TaxID=110365 RepID=A0A023B350_GRENI|nr:helicase [Gregarina niphandrodes]EZG55077.1 helicase [Gregarina niphandrodes]|eukprot:XP_011131803.1 helicase [Gregarina niphandrodes]